MFVKGALMYLNEATLLNNLHIRYKKDKIYVSIYDILYSTPPPLPLWWYFSSNHWARHCNNYDRALHQTSASRLWMLNLQNFDLLMIHWLINDSNIFSADVCCKYFACRQSLSQHEKSLYIWDDEEIPWKISRGFATSCLRHWWV